MYPECIRELRSDDFVQSGGNALNLFVRGLTDVSKKNSLREAINNDAQFKRWLDEVCGLVKKWFRNPVLQKEVLIFLKPVILNDIKFPIARKDEKAYLDWLPGI